MSMDVVAALAGALDGLTVGPAGGFMQVFRYKPWGRHMDAREWKALAVGESILTVHRLASPKKVNDMGGGASQGRPVYDVHAYWQADDSLADSDAFLKAVVDAIEAAIHANEKTLAPASFVQPINSTDLTGLLGGSGTASLRYEVMVTLEALVDEVYG